MGEFDGLKPHITYAPDHHTGGETLYTREHTINHIMRNSRKYSALNPFVKEELRKRKCGDGRDDTFYGEPIFGADPGYTMVVLEAGKKYIPNMDDKKTAKKVADITLSTLAGNSGINYAHTASELHGVSPSVARLKTAGCGHFKEAFLRPGLYSLNQQDMEIIIELMDERNFQIASYDGDHKEGAVVMIENPNITVRAFDPDVGTSVFIVNPARIKARLSKLGNVISEKMELGFLKKSGFKKELVRVWQAHTATTKGVLAPSKPIYRLLDIDRSEYPDLRQA